MTTTCTTDFVTRQCDAEMKYEPRLTRKPLLAVLDDRSNVVEIIQKRPYTAVKITSWYNRVEYTGTGFSKVCYPDTWDAEQGVDIAFRRALIDIYRQVRFDEDVPF